MNEQTQGLDPHQLHAQRAGHDRINRKDFMHMASLGFAALAAACTPAVLAPTVAASPGVGPTAGATSPGGRQAEETPAPTRTASEGQIKIEEETERFEGETLDETLGNRFFDSKGELKEEIKPFLTPTAQAWGFTNEDQVAQDLKNPATALRLIATAAFPNSGAPLVLRSGGQNAENVAIPIKPANPITSFAGLHFFVGELDGKQVMITGSYKNEKTGKFAHIIVEPGANEKMTDREVDSETLQKMLPAGWSYLEESETGQPTISQTVEPDLKNGETIRKITIWESNDIGPIAASLKEPKKAPTDGGFTVGLDDEKTIKEHFKNVELNPEWDGKYKEAFYQVCYFIYKNTHPEVSFDEYLRKIANKDDVTIVTPWGKVDPNNGLGVTFTGRSDGVLQLTLDPEGPGPAIYGDYEIKDSRLNMIVQISPSIMPTLTTVPHASVIFASQLEHVFVGLTASQELVNKRGDENAWNSFIDGNPLDEILRPLLFQADDKIVDSALIVTPL